MKSPVKMEELSFLHRVHETSYYSVELWGNEQVNYKCYTLCNDTLQQALLQNYHDWPMPVLLHHNHLILLFPYEPCISLAQLIQETTSFDTMIVYLQEILLTIQEAKYPSYITQLLCDRKTLARNHNGTWNVFYDPHIEQCLRKQQQRWQTLVQHILEETVQLHYATLPTPKAYITFMEHMHQAEMSRDDLMSELSSIKGCFNNLHIHKRLPIILHRSMMILLLLMSLLSIAIIAYEYVKQRTEYFEPIIRIGDLQVINK